MTRVMITVPEDHLRGLKVKAAQADMTLSEYLVNAGSIVDPKLVEEKQSYVDARGVPPAK